MNNPAALVTLIAYGVLLLGIGLWASARAKSSEKFLLGDRQIGPLVAGIAYAASSSSAWVLLGFSGFVYATGVSALWMVPGILAGYLVVWLWAGRMLQDEARANNHLTLTDLLAHGATPKAARLIRILASLMIAFCFSYYVAAQLRGAGQAFDGLFATGIPLGVLIGTAIVLAYTFLGGFMAVSLTDTIQGLLMAGVAILLPALAFVSAGGWDGIAAGAEAAPASFSAPFGSNAGWIALGFVVGMSATGFGALGQPHLIAWIMAARDRRARIVGGGIATGWAIVVYAGMAVLGLSARAIFGADAPAESVFFALTDQLLPDVFAGIIAAATLSAIMSTVDSQLLVAGAAVTHDLGVGRIGRIGEVFATRVAIAALCIAAIALTLALPASIFDRTLFAWNTLGAAFGPAVIARTLGLRVTGWTMLAGLLAGFGAAVAFEFWLPPGPGSVWARILPWAAGIAALASAAMMTNGKTAVDLRHSVRSDHG